MGDANSPAGILTGLVVLGLIVGAVIYDSALTVGGAIDIALQNPLPSAIVGLLVVGMLLYGKRDGPTDDA